MHQRHHTAPLTVLLGDYPHTRPLKDGSVPVDGADCHYPESTPLPPAFARMVRYLAYDICEMPMVTYLQAKDAGIPVTLLPAVMVGSTHHRSLTRLPEGPQIAPGDLVEAGAWASAPTARPPACGYAAGCRRSTGSSPATSPG